MVVGIVLFGRVGAWSVRWYGPLEGRGAVLHALMVVVWWWVGGSFN